jgi:ATP-dependent helicase/nuclease subunit A
MSRQPLPDQAARDFIRERLDVNVLVEAGAGSGKTESLAQRMVAGIVTGGYQVSEMAAVTFTRKAAAELRGRFQVALETRLKEETNEQAKARIRQALAGLETLFAGTIHSFCARLLRERPVEAGLAPGFTEIEEADDERIRKQAWRDYLARERALDNAVLREFQEADVQPSDLDNAFGKVCTFEEVDFPAGDAPKPDTAKAWKAYERFLATLQGWLTGPLPEDTTCVVQDRLREGMFRLRVARRDHTGDLVALLRKWESMPKFVQYQWSDDAAEKKRIEKEVTACVLAFQAATVEPFFAAWRPYIYRLAMTLLVDARAFARDARFRALTLNYGDLLQGAARLGRTHPEVRRVLQRKYRWLYVDEFQDTDPVQAEVMLWLASEEATPDTAADPFAVRLRPGSLFIVGDPKQSIFRFRRADIQVYNHVRQIIEANGGRVVSLTASWRSVSAVCDWATTAFNGVFPPEATDHQAAFQALTPVTPKAGGGVRVLDHPGTIKNAEVIAADAEVIANYVKATCDAGERTPGDFLVLIWKKKRLACYAAALEARQIPIEVSGGGTFGESEEVCALAALLHALGDPDDAVRVVAVLRGLFFGISDEELYQHKLNGGWFTIDRKPASDDGDGRGHVRVRAALRSLAEMAELTRTLPAAAAVERILEFTGFLALAAASTPGAAEAGDLMQVVDRVRAATEDGGTLADAVSALEEDIGTGHVESWPLEPGRTDVVRVMNLHKAKGLEAEVVFLADPCGGFESEADMRIDRQEGRATGHLQIVWKPEDNKGATKLIGEPAGWAAYQATEQPFLDAEADRLRYVAATRAKELLVISRWLKDGKKKPWTAFDRFLSGIPALELPKKPKASTAKKTDLTEKTRKRLATERDARLEASQVFSYSVDSVTGLTHRDIVVREDDPARVLRGAAAGAEFGDLVHKLLEYAMRRRTALADVERFANWLTFQDVELKRAVPEAVAAVARVMASDVWRQAQASADCDVEIPFTLVTKAADGTPSLLAGVIDLAYRSADGWYVVDYKTDQLSGRGAAELLERYAGQLESYRRAWSEFTGEPTVRVGLHAVRAGETVWKL